MQSIKTIKKLLKKYPIFVEFRYPNTLPPSLIHDGLKRMREQFGSNILFFAIPVDEQPLGVLKPTKKLTDEEKAQFINDWEAVNQSGGSSPVIFNHPEVEFHPLNQVGLTVHTLFNLKSNQLKEVTDLLKETSKALLEHQLRSVQSKA